MPPFTSNTAPIEIWERILHEAITFDSNLALEVTCSPETYLAFRATCQDSRYYPPMEAYIQSEIIRRKLRLVCRTWKAFADDAKYQDRWVRLRPYKQSDRSYATWNLPTRIDVDFRRVGRGTIVLRSDATENVMCWLGAWRDWQISGRGEMRLVRLEILGIDAYDFNLIFDALCQASKALAQLRSLSINVPTRYQWFLDELSEHFPQLVHLTLDMQFGDEQPSQARPSTGALTLEQLEVLFLLPHPGIFDLGLWVLPRIHTVKVKTLLFPWETHLYPFLQRHANTIESLDLDNTDSMMLSWGVDIVLPVDFWDTFVHLRLLRVELQRTVFPGPPKDGHSLRWLVDTNPVYNVERIGMMITSAEKYGGVDPETMAIYMQRIKDLCLSKLDDVPRALLREMETNGVHLISSSGKRLQE